MEPPAPGSGLGAAEPVEEDRVQEPADGGSNSNASSNSNGNGAPRAAAPPPPRATPLHLEQAGGGADGSSPATVADPRKGKEPLLPMDIHPPPSPAGSSSSSSSSTRSLDYGAAFRAGTFRDGVAESSTAAALRAGAFGDGAAGGGRARVRWSHPVVAETTEVPNAAEQPFDSKTVFEQMVIERLIQEQVADEKANRRREQQEKLQQVKVRPRPEKGKSPWSWLKNKIFCREGLLGRQIRSEHVRHQTHPITEVRNRGIVPSNGMTNLDAYSEIRPVIGDGECFYRSFIFSYLEQVIDRQDTLEEHRLLHVVERVPTQHAKLGWNSEFSRSCRAFKELIEKVMKWKSTESTSSRCKEKLLTQLLKFFSTYDETKDTVEICSHGTVYVPSIPEVDQGNCSLEDWCLEHVIPARVDADHVMLLALATALQVPLRVESFQQGYARDIYTGPGVPRPSVTLLYSGNHYNIIYPRAPSAESSSHQASQRKDPGDQSSSHQASKREDPGDQSSSHQASKREDPGDQSSSHQASKREDPGDQSSTHQASQREDPGDQSSTHQASKREDPGDQSSSHQASQREDPGDQSSTHQASKREDPAGQS